MAHLALQQTIDAEQIEAGLNSNRHRERWKYTKPARVMELLEVTPVDPQCSLPLQPLKELPFSVSALENPEVCQVLATHGQARLLNIGKEVDEVTISHSGASTPLFIRLERDANTTLVEEFSSDTPQYQVIYIQLEDNARLQHARDSFADHAHWQYLKVTAGPNAHYTLHNHAAGSVLRRQDVEFESAGSGSSLELNSAAKCRANTEFDLHTNITHCAPQATSIQHVHNIVADKAKSTFNGRIHILSHCPGVDAQLSNRNLALGQAATINTKPELEIYTDDVKCAHGATIGQLDEDHLFYFASRGIAEDAARQTLSRAFLNEVISGPTAESAAAYLNG